MKGFGRLVLASNNPGKLREIGALLAPLDIVDRLLEPGELVVELLPVRVDDASDPLLRARAAPEEAAHQAEPPEAVRPL